MAETNFVRPARTPNTQVAWTITPRVEVFTTDDSDTLAAGINAWVDDLSTPVVPTLRYEILDIKYTSAPMSNVIMFSALVHYNIWQRV